jgi:hypothetical protein
MKKELLSMPAPAQGTLPARPGDTLGAKDALTKLPFLMMIPSPKDPVMARSQRSGCPRNRFDKARITKYAAIATLPPVKVRAR